MKMFFLNTEIKVEKRKNSKFFQNNSVKKRRYKICVEVLDQSLNCQKIINLTIWDKTILHISHNVLELKIDLVI